MTDGSDWRVRFHVDARVVYDALLAKNHPDGRFVLDYSGMRFAGTPSGHPGPPERFWVTLWGTMSLDEAAATRYGLAPAAAVLDGNDLDPGCREEIALSVQIWRTAPGICEAEMRIAPGAARPHREHGYMDGMPLPTGRMALLLAAFLELLCCWPQQGGPQPWPVGQPNLVVRRELVALAPDLLMQAPEPAVVWATAAARRGGRPRCPEDAWAHHQVRRLGRRIAEVLPEWEKRMSPERREGISNTYRAFTQMLYRMDQWEAQLAAERYPRLSLIT
jgi:hypothetical protein